MRCPSEEVVCPTLCRRRDGYEVMVCRLGLRLIWYPTGWTIVFTPGVIAKKKRAIWQRESRWVYLRCPSCMWINRISRNEVRKGGYVRMTAFGGRNCVTCSGCGLHFFSLLSGWTPLSGRKQKTEKREINETQGKAEKDHLVPRRGQAGAGEVGRKTDGKLCPLPHLREAVSSPCRVLRRRGVRRAGRPSP